LSCALSDNDEQPASIFDVVQGSHNFVFSPDGADLWIFSGRTGVTRMNPLTGEITARLLNFNGAVRSLSFTPDGRLLVSATNEITLIDPKTLQVRQRIGNLGVTQLLYSKTTPDNALVLAPAVWEGQIIVIDLAREKVVHRIVTGVDPVQVMIPPGKTSAYVTHGRSRWLSEIEFDSFRERLRIATRGGPNRAAFAPWSPSPSPRKMTFGACLPFTGEPGVEGREIRLGYQHWQERVNGAGGLMIDGQPHLVEIKYSDTASTLCVAEIAESRRVPFVVGVGVSDELFQRNYRFVSGVVSDEFRFDSVLRAIWRRLSPKPATATVMCCDDPYVLKRARATAQRLRDYGFALLSPHGERQSGEEDGITIHPHLTEDLLSLTTLIRDLGPDLLLHHGHRQEAIVLVRACAQTDFTPGAIGLDFGMTVATFRDQLGVLTDNLIGSVHWMENMDNCAHDRFTTAADFGRNYFEEFSERASALAAASAACGIVFEHALHETQAADPDRVQAAIRRLMWTVFSGESDSTQGGRTRFPSPAPDSKRVTVDLSVSITLCCFQISSTPRYFGGHRQTNRSYFPRAKLLSVVQPAS
jgi:ABC-type branched-subunit amino acid transport system substrate-binding protein